MSDVVIVALITAVPSTLSFLLMSTVVFHGWHVPGRVEELIKNTNGLTEKLMDKTAMASHAEGMQDEKSRVHTDADVKAAVIKAAARLAADEILAAAKLAKEG